MLGSKATTCLWQRKLVLPCSRRQGGEAGPVPSLPAAQPAANGPGTLLLTPVTETTDTRACNWLY